MRVSPLLVLQAAFLSTAAFSPAADPRPIRVLYFDAQGAEQMKAGVLRRAMEQLGRDAIYFDYFTAQSGLNEKLASLYDVALVPNGGDAPELAALKGKGRVLAVSDGDQPAAIRANVVGALDAGVKAEWEKFLAQREPEKREPNPNVANYEKRPEAITFQHPLSVKGAMERTQVPADLKLQLFASEPNITKPIAFAWDERGRLWVAETRDYPHGYSADGVGNDDIKICEDTDGDGVADKFTVFADKLNIPTSIVFANGGIIVAQPPRFIFLKSSKGDDHADVRKEILTGWGIGDTHGQAGNLHYGYDNWLYGSVGYDGFEGAVGGKAVKFTMGTYRFKADGSALEFLHQFTNNTWAHGANDAGDQFGGTANGAPIFYGGIPASHFPEGMRGMSAKKINLVNEARAITPNYRQVDVMGTDPSGAHWGGYTAAAGSSFLYSSRLPARFQGKALVCEPTMKLVNLMDVQPDGAGYKALDAMPIFASSDEWTSPVCAEVGPDGAVWIADWQNFIIQHNPTPSVERGGYNAKTGPGGAHENDLRDHSRGRIYRIVARDTPAKMPKPLAGAGAAELVAALNADTQYWRLTAQRLLVDGKKADAADSLKKLVLANDGAVGAIHALWALNGLGALDEATHRAALYAKDARLRRNAVRALGDDAKAQALFFGSGVVSDADLNTRLAAFVKLSEFSTTPEIQTLVKKLAADPVNKGDEWLKEAGRLLVKKHKAESYHEGPNLLPNPGFETIAADGLPEGWKRRDYNQSEGTAKAKWEIVNEAHSGKNAVRCITLADADTSLFADVPLKQNAQYKLSGWVRSHALRGKVSLNDHITHAETDRVSGESQWTQVETIFTNTDKQTASINILHVAKGDGFWDDVKLCELIPDADPAEQAVVAGDAKRGEDIFWKHPVAACMNCHMLGGKGSTVGPALDGIATRKDEAYITESLLDPNAKLAEGFEKLGVSPMPPMGLILKPQEIADIKAFLLTQKAK